MENSPLENLSLLESLQGAKRADELDIYIPFIASMLDEMQTEIVDKAELQEKLNQKFNIVTPIGAIDSLLVRAKKQDLLFKENRQYFIKMDKVREVLADVQGKRSDIEHSVNRVVDSYLEFCKTEFEKSITRIDAESEIYHFIRKNISIFSGNITKNELSEDNYHKSDVKVASFIKHINTNKKSLIPDITKIVKGTLLANYLTIVDKSSTKRKFNNISIYLDTPIVIGLIGWDGPKRETSLKDFMSLLASLNINVKIFERTYRELIAVLSEWKDYLSNRQYDKFHEMTRQLILSRGTTPEQLSTELTLLESTLASKGISIDKSFKLDPNHCCDEQKLDKFLKLTGFKKRIAREHDTCCISNIYNTRKNRVINTLNDNFSIFITVNKSIEHVTRRFFKEEIPSESIPLVTSENWISTLLWLKDPDRFKNFPFDMLLTDAYSTLNSDDSFWRNFLRRLEQLKSNGGITEEQFLLVRYNNSLFGMVKHDSAMKEEDLEEEDVYKIIQKIKDAHLKEKEKEIKEKDVTISDLEKKVESTDVKTLDIAKKISKFASYFVIIGLFLLWVLAIFFTEADLYLLIKNASTIGEMTAATLAWSGATVILLIAYLSTATQINNFIQPRIERYVINFLSPPK